MSLVKISKFLSLVLRHKPESIGLTLSAEGWADVAELLAKAAAHGMIISPEQLVQVVHENDKQRFALNDDHTQIRANQGHSLNVDLALQPMQPPEVLFHGTATRFLDSIQATGLQAQQRQYVHLSVDETTAVAVGKRHGKAIVLTVHAGQMAAQGYHFYRAENGVWLTEHVPVSYLTVPESST